MPPKPTLLNIDDDDDDDDENTNIQVTKPILTSPTTGPAVPPVGPTTGPGVPPVGPTTGQEVPPVGATTGPGVPPVVPTTGQGAPPVAPTTGQGVPPAGPTTGPGVPPVGPATGPGVPPVGPVTGQGVPPVGPATGQEVPPVGATTGPGVPPVVPTTEQGVPPVAPTTGQGVPPAGPTTGPGVPPVGPATGPGVPPVGPATGQGVPPVGPATGQEVPPVRATTGPGVPLVGPTTRLGEPTVPKTRNELNDRNKTPKLDDDGKTPIIGNKNTQVRSSKPKYFLPKKESSDDSNKKPLPKSAINDTVCIEWSDSEDDDEDDEGGMSSNPPSHEPNDLYGIRIRRRFKPKLYDFVLKDYDEIRHTLIVNERKFDDNFIIRCPEFAILLDHVIAIIWYFYRDWRMWNNFNVPQLEWAIKFIGGIINQGSYLHLEIIKRHLQELLFINYTEVPENLVATPENEELEPQIGLDIPISLKAMLNPAPEFQQYLSTTAPRSTRMKRNSSQLDDFAATRVHLIKAKLGKLNAYEIREEIRLSKDEELYTIIEEIKDLAEEIVGIREQLAIVQ